jgi:trans-2-enoyl-CoA reductase
MAELDEATITEIDDALTHATTEDWRTWSEYIDKLLDQRLEVTQ